MLLEHERYYGLGMDAIVTVCSWNTKVIMVWAWALWSPRALGKRTFSWFGHGCYSDRMLLENERHCGLAMGATAGMLLEHERYYGLGMDAPVTVCSRNTNDIMVWAWMLSSSSALHYKSHFELDMDATVTVCSWNTNVIMVWAWMLQ